MISHKNKPQIHRVVNFILLGLLVWLLYQPAPAVTSSWIGGRNSPGCLNRVYAAD